MLRRAAGAALEASIAARRRWGTALRQEESVAPEPGIEEIEPKGKCYIDKLPAEILIKIMAYQVLSNESFEQYERMHHLAQVCRKWAILLKSTPEFWTVLSDWSPNWLVHTIVKRSGNRALDIFYLLHTKTDFWDIATSQLARWEMAMIQTSSLCELLDLNGRGAPLLKSLSVAVSAQPGTNLKLDLLSGGTPQLRHLYLSGIIVQSWESSLLKNLDSLRLEGITDAEQDGLSLKELFSVLRGCPGLEKLVLGGLAFCNTPEGTLRAHGKPLEEEDMIKLPRLRSLSLVDLYPSVLPCDIFKRLIASDCTEIILGGYVRSSDSPGTFPEDFITSSEHYASALKSALSSCDSLRLELRGPHRLVIILVSSGEERPIFSLDFRFHWAGKLIPNWLMTALDEAKPLRSQSLETQVLLCGPRLLMPAPALTSFLERLPHITSIECIFWEATELEQLLEGLSGVNVQNGPFLEAVAQSLAYPELQHLIFKDCRNVPEAGASKAAQLVKDLIRKRNTTSIQVAGAGLKSCTFANSPFMNEATFAEIDRLLGKDRAKILSGSED